MNQSIHPPFKNHLFFTVKEPYPLLESPEKRFSSNEFTNEFNYREYAIITKTEEQGTFTLTDKKGFILVYCWSGDLSIAYSNTVKSIAPYQSAILFNKYAEEIVLKLDNLTNNRFCVIRFEKGAFDELATKDLFYGKLERFLERLSTYNYIYVGEPNLRLLEKINDLSYMSKDSLASEFIIQGLLLQVWGLKLTQILESFSAEPKQPCALNKKEIERLRKLSEFIKENPGLDYSVDFLCEKTGLSPCKLQEGFKLIHDRTAIDFIRNVRLEKSMELIKTTDLNISEIVYSIGLTSRSYFSKIFKEKYKCSPKHYQDGLK